MSSITVNRRVLQKLIPIAIGYLALGIACGILAQQQTQAGQQQQPEGTPQQSAGQTEQNPQYKYRPEDIDADTKNFQNKNGETDAGKFERIIGRYC